MSVRYQDALGITRVVVITLYTGAIAIIQIMAGEPRELWWWLGLIPFFLWTIAPVVFPLAAWGAGWFYSLSVGAIAAYLLFVYWQSMFGPDVRSTSGLIFIFLPIYQWGAVALVAVLGLVLSRIQPQ